MSQTILFLHKFFTRDGGIERVHKNLAEALQHSGQQVLFYVHDVAADPTGFAALNAQYTACHGPHQGGFITGLRALFAAIETHRVEVIIAATETANLLAWCCAIRFPSLRVIYTRHCAFDVSDQKLPPWLIKRLYNLYAMTNQRIVAVSAALRDEIRRVVHVSGARIEYIPNAVISQRIGQLAQHNTEQVDYGEYFCAVGRLVEQKGFDLLLRAYAHAKTLDPALPKLVIVGEGEDRSMLEAMCEELQLQQDVILHGFTPNPYYIIKHARAFVLSSRFEGMPTVLIEAMHLQTPVIAFDCPTGPSEIIRHGENGFLVRAGDIYALAGAMLRYQQLNRRDTATSVSCFQFDDVARAYIAQWQG